MVQSRVELCLTSGSRLGTRIHAYRVWEPAQPIPESTPTSAGSIAASIRRIVAILANADQFRMLRPFGAQVEAVAGGMWCVNAQARF